MGQPLFLCLIHGPWDVGLRLGHYDWVNDTKGRKYQEMYRRGPQAKFAEPETGYGMTRLLICDDSGVILECLVSVLSPYPQIDIVGTAANGVEAVDKTRELLPDLVIMDARMPVMDGVEATRIIKTEHPSVGVLLLSVFTEPFEEAVAAGADGCMVKDCEPKTLVYELGRIQRRLASASSEPASGYVTGTPDRRLADKSW